MTDVSRPTRLAPRSRDLGLALAVLLVTAVVFWPAARWLATQAFAREQLKQSFLIVLLAGAWIALEKRHTLRVGLALSNETIAWFIASYGLAAAAVLVKNPLFFLAGLVTAAGGLVNYVFGRQALRRTLPLLSVFALLIVSVLLFPVLDWPLRQMAGIEAAKVLKALGLAPELAITLQDSVPRLILKTPRQDFLVATECNGFGLISSALLLGLIRMLYHRATWPFFVVLLPCCVAIGFICNFLRIAAIVLLAPRFPGHYHALHEAAGFIALYSGLGLVWWLSRNRTKTLSPRPSP